jgi:rod shape-determining protein MreC
VRNFLLFIRRFFNLILFIVLEVICVVLIARTNNLQGNDIMSSANTVVGIMYKEQNDVVYYFGLKRLNDSLMNENVRLYQLLAKQNNTYFKTHDSNAKVAIPPTDSNSKLQYADYTTTL